MTALGWIAVGGSLYCFATLVACIWLGRPRAAEEPDDDGPLYVPESWTDNADNVHSP